MRRSGLAAALALLAWLGPACGPRASTDPAGRDQEITAQVMWALRADPRFADVRVACADRVVTLSGRVSDPQAAQDAVNLALTRSRGAQVVHRLDIRPR